MTAELAWAAGFFEGEGNVYVPPPDQGKGLRLAIGQSDDDGVPAVLLRFQAAVGGVGDIFPCGPNELSRKQRYQWRIQQRTESRRILDLLQPYFTPGGRFHTF